MALILFIDDEPDTLSTMEKAVQLLGHRALLAQTEAQALELIKPEMPDLIFIDLQLSDTDGFSLVRNMRQAGSVLSHVPIIILSAGLTLDAALRAQEAGAQAYLLKPVRLQTLVDLIVQYAPSALEL
jgi:CheY-like chemotaxis protein